MHLSIILNKLLLFTKGKSSSETQGQIVGARESLNGWEKMARRKVKNGRRARGDNLLPDQFQTVAAVLAFDWCKKLLCFSAQSECSRPWNPICVFLHAKYMKESAVRHVYLGCSRRLYTRR